MELRIGEGEGHMSTDILMEPENEESIGSSQKEAADDCDVDLNFKVIVAASLLGLMLDTLHATN